MTLVLSLKNKKMMCRFTFFFYDLSSFFKTVALSGHADKAKEFSIFAKVNVLLSQEVNDRLWKD